MFRRLFYALLFLAFVVPGLVSAYLLYIRYLTWASCTDRYGRCFDAAGVQQIDITGIALAYTSITFVLAMLTLWAMAGMLRRKRRPRPVHA
ncbi:MAG: hypothetical protein JNM89_10125 [Hyphomicrobiaceae bacterium]|nr:hypothetical protein [Hyphomicrobiaceae bacterium]